MKHHYTYRITNIKNKLYYYGVRTSNNVIPSEDIGYIYFSTSLDRDFIIDQKENPQDYKYKVVKEFATRVEAEQHEITLHEKFNVKVHKSFYNKANATSTGFSRAGVTLSEEQKEKIGKSNLGIKKPTCGKHLLNEDGTLKKDIYDKMCKYQKENPSMLGETQSIKQKVRASEVHKGKIISEEQKEKTLKSDGYKNRKSPSEKLKEWNKENVSKSQKQYIFYDKDNIIKYKVSRKSLKNFCKDNNLPYTAFYESVQEKGSPLYQTTYSLNRVKKKGWDIYEGWRCVELASS